MRIDAYRRVLAVPGVRALMLLILLVRIPLTATTMVLTLHVVLDLHRGYGAAGLVGAAATIRYRRAAVLTPAAREPALRE